MSQAKPQAKQHTTRFDGAARRDGKMDEDNDAIFVRSGVYKDPRDDCAQRMATCARVRGRYV
eukprot:3009214-Amphidinium_carterae.1